MRAKLETDEGPLLLISAPYLGDHHFMGGVRGNLVRLDGWDIDWSNVGLTGGAPKSPLPTSKIPSDVPPTVCQFERGATGTGDLVGKTSGSLLLPWPLRFLSLRLGAMPSYKSRTDKPSKVGEDIRAHCYQNGNKQLGVVTVLQYASAWSLPGLLTWAPNMNFHFYFQPAEGHDIDGVNADLTAASNIFQNPDYFDVQIDPNSPGKSIVVPIGAEEAPVGLGPEDELALNEKIQLYKRDELEKPLQPIEAKVTDQALLPEIYTSRVIASTANCPLFFVGP